ncbi:MAG: TIGR03118 family protein [Phycisphaerae bacterium]|nr:TIGR03118 family protein [Phycisphaerae bacterium]
MQTAAAQFTQRDLVSDGTIAAEHVDPNLVNAWGIVPNPTGVRWVSDAATGRSTLYDGEGMANSLVVTVPSAADLLGGAPTGIVFNGSSQFVVSFGFTSGAARFIVAGEAGTISGWAPAVPAPPPSTMAILMVDNSQSHAVYKGLALATSDPAGPARLYATDFPNRSVHVLTSR